MATLADMGFNYEDQLKMPISLQYKLLMYNNEIKKYEQEQNKKLGKR